MKKLIPCLVIMFWAVHNYAVAEDVAPPKSVTIFLGVALPVGDFAAADGSTQKAGFAKTGFGGGLEIRNSFNGTTLSGIGTISVSLNAMDADALTSISGSHTGYNVSVTAGSYISTFALYGLKYDAPISPSTSLYGQVQIGALISKMPEMTTSVTTTRSSVATTASMTTTSSIAFAFGYGAGVGIQLNDQFNVGIRYYAGSPSYSQTSGSYSSTLPMSTSTIECIVGFMF